MPENTVPAFLHAAELGCDWLELDVVLTGDGQVLVSHEPWMSARICLTPAGDSLTQEQGRALNIYRMSLAEAQAFDCGSRPHPDFPEQHLQRHHKPTLREVVEAVEEHILMNGLSPVSYNIEIKSRPEWYGVYQPQPGEMTRTVLNEIDALGISERCLLQSFDPAILEAAHVQDPNLLLALLVENEDGLEKNLARLSFTPQVYSPWFPLVDARTARRLRELDISLVVWTVNDLADMQRMVGLGVDGIISDHPERVLELLDARD